MSLQVKPYLSAGVAIVGAGAIALTPVAPPPDQEVRQAEVALAASPTSLLGGPFDSGVIEDFVTLSEGLARSGLRLGQGVLLSPMRVLAIAAALPQGMDAVRLAVASLIVNTVDAPLWVADPTIDALAEVLPGNLGADLADFRDSVLWQATQDINSLLLGILNLPDPEAAVQALTQTSLADAPASLGNALEDAVTLAQGFGESGMRLVSGALLSPLRVLAIAAALPQGMDAVRLAVASLIVNTVDAPLWVADPTIDALAEVLPGNLGADLADFRDSVLWQATQDINSFLLGALNLPDPEQAEQQQSLMNVDEGADAAMVRKSQPAEAADVSTGSGPMVPVQIEAIGDSGDGEEKAGDSKPPETEPKVDKEKIGSQLDSEDDGAVDNKVGQATKIDTTTGGFTAPTTSGSLNSTGAGAGEGGELKGAEEVVTVDDGAEGGDDAAGGEDGSSPDA